MYRIMCELLFEVDIINKDMYIIIEICLLH